MTESKPIQLLLVDDRMLTSELDRAGYRQMGFTVKSATSYNEIQKLQQDTHFDIIVLNYDHKQMDAIDICKKLKCSDSEFPQAIVITSVQSKASIKKAALAADADLFVEQPLPRQYFIEKLKKLANRIARDNQRIEVAAHAIIKMPNGEKHEIFVPDLSSSGLFLQTDIQLDANTPVDFQLKLEGYEDEITGKGTITRKVTPKSKSAMNGYGLQFTKLNKTDQRQLEKYIAEKLDQSSQMAYYL